ncbi:MAG: TonB-dependent receptor [Chitinophagaceae bacterium]
MKSNRPFCLMFLMLFFHLALFSQQTTISGSVTDSASSMAISGATIGILGSASRTISDKDGKFSLSSGASNAKLVVSHVGYLTQTVTLSGGMLHIVLIPEQTTLNDVVVVGYGTQKKVNLTGAVGQIKGKAFSEKSFANTANSIQGLSPGLTVIDRGGAPGQENANINIRGIGTLGNANPLILVDNIPVNSINDVRPADIADISVLKDAASAAIYGSRAANGVILITTKRGKKGATTINYNAYAAVQSTTLLPKPVGIKDYMDIINEGYINGGLAPKYSDDYIARTLSGEDPVKYPNTNWLDLVFKPGFQQNHAISMSGGTEKASYLLALNYLDQNGIVDKVNAKNYSMRLNNDFKLTDKLTVGADVAFTRKQNSQPFNVGDVYWTLYSDLAPTVAPIYPDGTYGIGSGNRSPLGAINASGYQNAINDNLFLNLKAGYNILPGLNVNANYAANLYKNSSKNRRFDYVFRDYYTKNELSRYNSYLYYGQGNSSESNARLTVDYKKTFGVHDLTVLAGVEQTLHKDDQLSGTRSLFYSNDLSELGLGDPTTRDNSSFSTNWSLQSLFGRINYALMDKYLVEVNMRRDGSSRFAEGRRYGVFPSFSAGWILSKENFMESISFIDNLKLRASWGQLGNQDIGLYQYQQTVALQQNYTFGGQLVNGAAVNTLANKFITWETSTSTNLGLDAQFLNNKFGFTADIFKKRTRDILLTLNIPYTIGLGAPVQNAGVVENKGFELSAFYRNTIKDFSYGINVTFASIKNKVISLAGTGPYVSETSIIKTGESINAIFGYEAIGLFRTQEELNTYPRFNTFTRLGSVKYKDQNNDGLINNDDKIVIGPVIPRYTFSGDINLGWKKFFLNAFLQGAAKVYSMPRGGIFDGPYWGSFVTKDWLDRWTPKNPNGNFPSVVYQRSSPNLQPSTFVAQDVSYLRLKSIQIGYDLAGGVLQRIHITNARVYVSGTNLITLTKAKYVDPELVSGRYDSYPQVKMFSVGTNISF